MNDNLIHEGYYCHIKQGRNVIILTETYQFGKYHLRNVADHYRHKKLIMSRMMIQFENGLRMSFIASSSRAHDLMGRGRNTFVLVDDKAFYRLPPHHLHEYTSMVNRINERTMTDEVDKQTQD